MNLGDIVADVRRRLDELYCGLWRRADIVHAANSVDRLLYSQAVMLAPQWFRTLVQVTLPADTVETTWSTLDASLADLRKIMNIVDVTSGSSPNRGKRVLFGSGIKEMEQYVPNGHYMVAPLSQDRFRVKPTPTQARTWNVYYIGVPAAMSVDTDTPAMPEFAHDYLSLRTALWCANIKQIPVIAWMEEFKLQKATFERQLAELPVDAPCRIIDTTQEGVI